MLERTTRSLASGQIDSIHGDTRWSPLSRKRISAALRMGVCGTCREIFASLPAASRTRLPQRSIAIPQDDCSSRYLDSTSTPNLGADISTACSVHPMGALGYRSSAASHRSLVVRNLRPDPKCSTRRIASCVPMRDTSERLSIRPRQSTRPETLRT